MDGAQALTDAGVSAREAEVLAALGQHLTNAEIAARLYISVRTVESHVSSLLRKLDVADRRELSRLAEASAAASAAGEPQAGAGAGGAGGSGGLGGGPAASPARRPLLPATLTSFVGRQAERAALGDAVGAHRLVTAVGPGGVGKTRLALAVAADQVAAFADGSWFVDLVPASDAGRVPALVAGAVGAVERPGRTVEDAVVAHLAGAEALVVLDNCEHVVEGVAVFVERLLAGCPGVHVLATSRTRLVLPFENVFPVPGLSLPDDADGPDGQGEAGDAGAGEAGDAVALFVERAAAGGAFHPGPEERRRVAAVCRSLDGMALAIELAAARLPTLGLDGVEAGLADALRMLSGGSRLDGRHRSLRSTIGWSYELLAPAERALLGRVAVFAAPFTARAAARVAGWPPVGTDAAVADGLGRLADNSLAVVVPGAETRYRVLETIRQYGLDRLAHDGELDEVRARHVGWAVEAAEALGEQVDDPAWRAAFDGVADDLRAALGWATARPELAADAGRLALALADLAFQRGYLTESQRRYEQAAALATADGDHAGAAAALNGAAGAAVSRQVGNEAMRLWDEAAEAAIRAGDGVAAARTLAQAATLCNRGPGLMATPLTPETTADLLRRATAASGGAPEAEPAILTALAFAGDEVDPATAELAQRAVELAHRSGDAVDESAALDELSSVFLAEGDVPAALATVRRRVDLLDTVRTQATTGLELADGYAMASEISLAAGDIPAARAYADRVAALPFISENDHLALARRIKVEAMAGELDAVVAAAERFRRGWEESGEPVASNLAGAALAVAMVHGLRGDDAGRAEWLELALAIGMTPDRLAGSFTGSAPTFDAIVELHRGDAEAALARLATPPEQLRTWFSGQWRPWYAALWAEAAVLADRPDAAQRVERARLAATANPVALAMVARAAALAAGDTGALVAAAAALEPTGCRYQWARTLVLAGGSHAARGADELAALGAAPMAV